MSLNQSITIGNHSIQIYGSVDIPLFDAHQVIQSVLEYKQLQDNWFYKNNKNNTLFVAKIEDKQPSGETPVGQKGIKGKDNQYSNTTIYLTEFGLYECLFSSNKPIASQFRIQIMTLLRDIRIGNIKLTIQKECETTKLLEQNQTSILTYITKNSELEQQILKLQAKLDSSSEEVYIYEIEINGKFYRGTAIELIRRLKQHMKKSCNPSVRRACSEGIQLKTRLLHSQKVSNRHERNYIERQFIKQIPSDLRMNVNVPRVRDYSKVSEECKQELKQGLLINNNLDNLTVVDEQTTNDVKVQKQYSIDKWKFKYEQYLKFVNLLQRNPNDSDKDRNEKLIAKWVYKQRLNYDKLESWQQEQLSKIKFFKPEVKVINTESFEVKLSKVVNIYKEKGNLVSANLGNLFNWYCDYSKKMKLNEIGEYERVLFEQSGIPLYITSEEQWMQYYNQCLQIYNNTGKLPVDKQIQGQFNLGKWARRQKEFIDKLTDVQIKLLNDIGLLDKKCVSSEEYQTRFKRFVDQNKRLPQSKGDQSEVYLYKWMTRNKTNPIVMEYKK